MSRPSMFSLFLVPAWLAGCAGPHEPELVSSAVLPQWVEFGGTVPKGVSQLKQGEEVRVEILFENEFFALWPIRVGGIEVMIMTRHRDKERRVRGMVVYDKDAVTPEGIAVGARYSDIKGLTEAVPEARWGWGHFLALESGWFAIFWEGSTDQTPVSEDSRVAALATSDTLMRWRDRERGAPLRHSLRSVQVMRRKEAESGSRG